VFKPPSNHGLQDCEELPLQAERTIFVPFSVASPAAVIHLLKLRMVTELFAELVGTNVQFCAAVPLQV
jgi:hypothetical protein